jgi:8-oxo-dGTP diphosphatase
MAEPRPPPRLGRLFQVVSAAEFLNSAGSMGAERKRLRVSAGILRDGNCVLICRRRNDQEHPAKWEFPGGKIEAGESPAQCLRRELREELDIDAEVGRLIVQLRHEYPSGPTVELWFFEIPRLTGDLRNRVFAEIRWVTLAELPGFDLLEADRPLIEILARAR